MSDAPIPLPGRASPPIPAAPIDPLAGDWSEGLPGPVRALGVPEPRRLTLEVAAPVEAVAAPAAWEGATADPLHSTPDPAGHADAAAQDAPTPWSEPVADAGQEVAWEAPAEQQDGEEVAWEAPAEQQDGEEVAWEAPAEPAWTEAASQTAATSQEPSPTVPAPEPDHDAWLAPPPAAEEEKAQDAWAAPAEVVEEWHPEAPAAGPASVPEAVALPDAPPPDWSTLTTGGPDWSAPAEAAAPAQDGWDALPPAPAASDWMATPVAPPPPAVPAAGPAWNAPAVGASALEQLDSEPPEPEPGAAQKLFGSVPAGGSLSGDDEAAALDPLAAGDVAAPDVLAGAEDILTPLDPHDHPDLPVALDESSPPAKPLAALRPASAGALEVAGEHRVAVHTRGGRTLRGTVCDVDLSKSQFALQPQGGGSTETVYHSDVKVIFFMLPPGEKVQPAEGGRVRVKLSDGRVIEGDRVGAEARHGFFLVPGDAARTNTRRIYVAREAADEIEG